MAKSATSKIDIPQKQRVAVAALLNARLADAIDFSLAGKQAHWNVKGPNFIALHDLFDKIVEASEDWVDDIAERAVALGGTANGTTQAVGKATSLKAYPTSITAGRDHLDALSTSLAAFGKNVRRAIDESGKLGDADTADLFTGISREVDKYLWFLEAHLQ
jgi:starvation-inducible DNA-binding protein